MSVWVLDAPTHWRPLHTWTFIQPVISVFPVPDAPGILCVTLGQLEIREARVLCCSSLSQVALCEGEFRTVVGLSSGRVVSSSYSADMPSIEVYTLSHDGRLQASRSLVSPTEHVHNLAPVEGQTDALIGTTNGGHLFIWNVRTGHLLRRVTLGDSFTDAACLHGYSLCGVLFVLLQHTSLLSLGQEDEQKGRAPFSLVAINPLNGVVALATRLCLPKDCVERLVEVDVQDSRVIGVFQSGSVCIWQLGSHHGQQGEWLPDLGCQLAHWGAQGTLLTAHISGDVFLYRHRPVYCKPL
ncbi:hypothetical protein UPYG_G00053020 [Umbra pygmaea]|uniref:Partner and localiser of BRCA2 WD40 domain-containing protein n=1 Tax=Umbra pygmaea TaxID=75934 RepID=A0ABD0XV20_UMBPY